MYELYIASKRVGKNLKLLLEHRNDVHKKLKRLQDNPRKEIGAHPLHGRLSGKWSCWLGSDIRMVYSINDEKKQI